MRLPIFLQEVAAVYISSLGATGECVCTEHVQRERAAAARPSLKQVRLHQGSPKFKSSQGGRRGAGGNLGAAAACHHSRSLSLMHDLRRRTGYYVLCH
jgi:hypothetical protein